MELPLTTINTYPPELFKSAKIKEMIDNNNCFVVFGSQKSNLIDLDKVVGIVNDLKEDKDDLIVDFKVIETLMGKLFKTMFENNVKMALRPQGVGVVDINNVVTDYTLNCFWIDAE